MRQRALSLAVAIVVGVGLVSASGAATTKTQKVTKIDVSTRAAVVHYLRSIHVNAKHPVIQRGLRNYAGAHCPGTRWTCASTRHTVVQIAKQGGQNRFVCRSSKCAVVQISGTAHGVYLAGRQAAAAPAKPPPSGNNTAACVKTGSGATTGSGQSCTINQTGSGSNTAGVYENTQKMPGISQSAQYSASITQNSSGSGNTACVTQKISQEGSTTSTNGKPVTVSLDAHQFVTITQDSPAGNNSAQNGALSTGACDFSSTTLTQSQTQTSTVNATGPITQNENAVPNGTTANVVIKIDQNQGTPTATGSNNANFTQTINQTAIANTPKGPVTQTQSSQDDTSPFSGGVGTVNQTTTTGTSIATTTQNETQCEDAATGGLTTCHTAPGDADFNGTYTLIQNQFGPEGVFNAPAHSNGPVHYFHKGYGVATQTGGTGDMFTINQFSQQDADLFENQHNTQEADCLTPGICTVNQTVIIDGNTTSNGDSGQDLSGVGINCEPGETGTDCTQSPPPPSGPICDASSDTNALYNAMPTDVVNCINPAIGFQATSTNEFGDEVGLAGGAGATLGSLKVDFQSFACQSGSWNSDPAPCSSADGATFQWPITANIYLVGEGNTVGSLLATTTQTQTIPYRPSADTTGHCTGTVANKWWNPDAIGGGACQNSIGKVLTFSFPAGTTLPDQVIWTVAFNTSTHGYAPAGTTGICTVSGGCPYDSLNVGDKTYTGAPFAGTDTDVNTVAISTGSNPLALVTSAADWSAFRPLGEILVAPVIS